MSMLYSNLEMEFLLSNIEIPNKLSLFREKLRRYGIELSEMDKFYLVDSQNERVEVDEENFDSISKYYNSNTYSFANKITKLLRFVLVKFEKPSIDVLLSNFKHAYNHLGLGDCSMTQIMRDDNDMEKLLEGLQTFDNPHDQYKFFPNFNNFSQLENLSFHESIILSSAESCFQTVFKKYVNDFLSTLNNSQLKENNETNSKYTRKNLQTLNRTENDLKMFYDYFEKDNSEANKFYENLKGQYTSDEIKQAKESLGPFHNMIIALNEFKNNTINDLIKAIKNNYEKLKVSEYTIIEERLKYKSYKENFEINKGFFNKFMIELQENFEEKFEFILNNNNFDFKNFDENLSKVFSFLIKLSLMVHKISGEKIIKSEKYMKMDCKSIKISICNQCFNHKSCTDKKCPHKSKIYEEKINMENTYKNELLYDV